MKWVAIVVLVATSCGLVLAGERKDDSESIRNALPTSAPASIVDEIDAGRLPKIDARVPDDFVPHKDANSRFTIRTPAAWTESKNRSGHVAIVLLADTQGANVNVVALPPMDAASLKTAFRDVPKQLKAQFQGFKLIKSDFVLLHGTPSCRLVYEISVNDKPVRLMQLFLSGSDNCFILTYTAPASAFDGLYPTIGQVLTSFQFTRVGPTTKGSV